jgi:hypothetical protein
MTQMHRCHKIACDRNGFGGPVRLAGNVFGAAFQSGPNLQITRRFVLSMQQPF